MLVPMSTASAVLRPFVWCRWVEDNFLVVPMSTASAVLRLVIRKRI